LNRLRGENCVVVKDGASIGAHAVVLPGVTIGAGAMIGAGATVDRSVPDGHLLRRDGEIVPIAAKLPDRMRFTNG
jgi:acetyltransferase-like isoleucine patch superfamily enzyme